MGIKCHCRCEGLNGGFLICGIQEMFVLSPDLSISFPFFNTDTL